MESGGRRRMVDYGAINGLAQCVLLLVLGFTAQCTAQGVEKKSPLDESRIEMSPEDRTDAEALTKCALGLGCVTRADAMERARMALDPDAARSTDDSDAKRTADLAKSEAALKKRKADLRKLNQLHGEVVSQLLLWRRPEGSISKGFTADIFERRTDGSFSDGGSVMIPAGMDEQSYRRSGNAIRGILTDGIPTISFGETPPPDVLQEILPAAANYDFVHLSAYSPNETPWQILEAGALGQTGISPKKTSIFNALPINSNWGTSIVELRRLGVGGTRKEWRQLDRSIAEQSSQWNHYRRATKRSLLEELAHGNDNVVILFAHGNSQRLYLPGAVGGSISSKDLDRIRRSQAPSRVVVLFSCNAATHDATKPPLADQILKNRLARTVFAADTQLDAQTIPAVLQKLASGERLRSSLQPKLKQMVQLEPSSLHSGKERK
jgi:hypothetical protein